MYDVHYYFSLFNESTQKKSIKSDDSNGFYRLNLHIEKLMMEIMMGIGLLFTAYNSAVRFNSFSKTFMGLTNSIQYLVSEAIVFFFQYSLFS